MHAKEKFRKMFVCVRNSICGWKKNKKFFGPNFQNYLKNFLCRHQKNASHTIPIYGNCMISIFFKKTRTSVFITRLFYKNQTSTEISLYQFSTIFRNCMKIVWQAFFHTLDVWNCMITIFGVWRSTRAFGFYLHKNPFGFYLHKNSFSFYLHKNSNEKGVFGRSVDRVSAWNPKYH